MPLIPGLSVEPKRSKHNFGPINIFFPLNPNQENPNAKYLFHPNQFHQRNAPVLKFFADFDDRGDNPKDQMKFRKCHILYFVDDGTIKVYEPPQRNSGFEQGWLVNRNKIPKPGGGYYTLDDLNLGKSVNFYGKSFKILDCDKFTKQYLPEMGYRIGTPEPAVLDPVYADRQEMDKHRTTMQKPRRIEYKYAKFLKDHPKYLHFYAIYNCNPPHFEDIRYVSLYYDIVNKTIKIVDEKKLLEYKDQLRCGNYDSYLILKPTKVPKLHISLNPIGSHSDSSTVLNLTALSRNMHLQQLMSCRAGGGNNPRCFLRDSNPATEHDECSEYFTAKDLNLGLTLNIFGSIVFLYDSDEFTKDYYRNEFNREMVPVTLTELKEPKYHQLVYKKDFGNPEDSLQTSHQLPTINVAQQLLDSYILSQKPCHKGTNSENLLKFYINCRFGNNGKVLKFLCRIATSDPFIKDQYFVISWFLEDDTIEINGLDLNFTLTSSDRGKFLKRMKLIKPTSEEANAATSYYSPKDLFVGNIIYAIQKPFLIIDADEYTYDYMEQNCDTFPFANIKDIFREYFPLIREKTLEFNNAFEKIDFIKSGFVCYNDFRNILLNFIPENKKNSIVEHQIKTLARYFAHEEFIGIKYEELTSKIQSELKNQRFEDFEKLETLFHLFDANYSDNRNSDCHFEEERVYKILRSYPMPIDRDLLKSFIFKFPKHDGLISGKEVVNALNYFENPVQLLDHNPYSININWEGIEKELNINKICYDAFLKELTNEKCPNCK